MVLLCYCCRICFRCIPVYDLTFLQFVSPFFCILFTPIRFDISPFVLSLMFAFANCFEFFFDTLSSSVIRFFDSCCIVTHFFLEGQWILLVWNKSCEEFLVILWQRMRWFYQQINPIGCSCHLVEKSTKVPTLSTIFYYFSSTRRHCLKSIF